MQARKFAQPSVFPAYHFKFSSFSSFPLSVTLTTTDWSACSSNVISTVVLLSQTKEIKRFFIILMEFTTDFCPGNSGHSHVTSAPSSRGAELLEIKYRVIFLGFTIAVKTSSMGFCICRAVLMISSIMVVWFYVFYSRRLDFFQADPVMNTASSSGAFPGFSLKKQWLSAGCCQCFSCFQKKGMP